jgi:hypothetical protein
MLESFLIIKIFNVLACFFSAIFRICSMVTVVLAAVLSTRVFAVLSNMKSSVIISSCPTSVRNGNVTLSV